MIEYGKLEQRAKENPKLEMRELAKKIRFEKEQQLKEGKIGYRITPP